MKHLRQISFGLALAASTIGFGSTVSAANICFAFQDLETEFWVASHKAIVETLTEMGHSVIERNANEDVNRQLEQVRDCVAQGVDGIILIPQDGESAVTIVKEATSNDVPVVVFNRPPANNDNGVIVVADNAAIAETAAGFVLEQAIAAAPSDAKLHAVVIVGDLGDTNAIQRKKGFEAAVAKFPERFDVTEVASDWDAATALANLEAAVTAKPKIDAMFTSSDFLFPTIRSVLEPRGMWKKTGEEGHIPLAGLDGDATACKLIKEGYVDATGVQDLYFEAEASVNAIVKAIEAGETDPNEVIADPGFALTSANLAEREMDMWGCKLLAEGFLDN